MTVTKSKNPRSDKKFDQAREEAFSGEGAPPPTQDGAVPANTGGRKRLKTGRDGRVARLPCTMRIIAFIDDAGVFERVLRASSYGIAVTRPRNGPFDLMVARGGIAKRS